MNIKKLLTDKPSSISTIIGCLLILFLSLLVRDISNKIMYVDSDEVMWSVMADLTINKGQQFLYFTTQTFRGSLESYVMIPFQKIFGLSSGVLRINSTVFGSLTAVLLYLLVKKLTRSQLYGVVAGIFYLMVLPNLLVVQTKAWGNYVFIQFAMIACFYLFTAGATKNKPIFFILTGLISGLSFWANEQAIFFLFVILLLGFLYDFFLIKKSSKNKRIVINTYVIYFVNLAIVLFCFYLITMRKTIFNPALTLLVKLRLTNLEGYVPYFNFSLLHIIYFAWAATLLIYLLGIFLLKKQKISYKNSNLSVILVSTFSFIGFAVNAYHNSFSRISASGDTLIGGLNFFNNIILKNFFDVLAYPVLIIGVVGVYLRVREIVKSHQFSLTIADLFLTSFILFPILFLLASAPNLTPSPRYLIIWWPVSVYVVLYTFYHLSKKSRLLPLVFILVWSLLIYSKHNDYAASYIMLQKDKAAANTVISKMDLIGARTCNGDYWRVGPVMFYSKLRIKCYTVSSRGHTYRFLDVYKPSDNQAVYSL